MTPASRPYVSVDVENILYGFDAQSDADRVEFLMNEVLPVLGDRWAGDAALARGRLASTLVLAVMDLPDGCDLRIRTVTRSPDAADIDLVERLTRAVPPRSERVVIVSGDHRFARPAQALKRHGVHVTCVGLRGHIHHRMWPACHAVIELDPPGASRLSAIA